MAQPSAERLQPSQSVRGEKYSDIVELRRYRLHRGARETLTDVFEREFIETQEAVGMFVLGQFHDRDRPDDFVWLRGFPDMESRRKSLAAFYTGPVWAAHKAVANGTMINSDNVLLLRPSSPGRAFKIRFDERPGNSAAEPPPGLIVATISYLAPKTDGAFAEFFEEQVRPALEEAGAAIRASFVSVTEPNSFPRLPVRERETVFVWFSSFPDIGAYEAHCATLAGTEAWSARIYPELDRRVWRPNEVAVLLPTRRSLLHG